MMAIAVVPAESHRRILICYLTPISVAKDSDDALMISGPISHCDETPLKPVITLKHAVRVSTSGVAGTHVLLTHPGLQPRQSHSSVRSNILSQVTVFSVEATMPLR